jgi:hypothetical protein
MTDAAVAHPGEPCDPPCEVEKALAAPLYSEIELNDAVDQRTQVLHRQYKIVLEGRSPVAVHNMLCGCVSADCGIRLRAEFILKPSSMSGYLKTLLDVRMVPSDVVDRVFEELSPADCDRMREFLVKAEGA